MALTQISTAGVKDDAVTAGKIPADAVGSSEIAANAVGSSELADNAVDTAAIADQAVTLAKLPHGTSSQNGKFLRANNGADPTFETVNTDLVADTSPQLGGHLSANGYTINCGDSSGSSDDRVTFGAGTDLSIYHDGSHSKIVNSTGELKVQGAAGQAITFRNGDDSANVAVFNIDADTHLYYDSAHKFSTTSDGCIINGHLDLIDSNKIRLGSSDDLKIYHDGTNSYIDNEVGSLILRDTGGAEKFKINGYGAHFQDDVTFYGTNANIQFDKTADALEFKDNTEARFGDGNDLKIYHDGSDTYIDEQGTGSLNIKGSPSLNIRTATFNINNEANSENMARFFADGAVELYYNNTKTLETASYGVNVISAGNSHGLYVSHSNGNEVARLAHNGSGDEGVLVLRDGGSSTVLINGESGQNGWIAGPNAFFLGTTAGVGNSQRGIQMASATSGNPVLIQTSSSHYSGGAYSHWYIYDDHGMVGNVNADGDGTASYNSASDYRLKENVVPITDGIEKLKTLKPYRFNFKTADASKVVQGFFAHEVSEAIPNAVKGTKDEMKSLYYEEGDTIPEGKAVGDFKEYSTTEINPQSLDHAKMVPMLTAALQEAIAKIEILETKVAALEAA